MGGPQIDAVGALKITHYKYTAGVSIERSLTLAICQPPVCLS